MLLPIFALYFVFQYIPIYGILIAFQNYVPGRPFIGPEVDWVGLKHILQFAKGEYFLRLVGNSIKLNLYNLLFGFTAPLLFALLINTIPSERFRKVSQTISYMPYFISTVIVAGMVLSFTGDNGLVTTLLNALGFKLRNLRVNARAFPIIYTVTNVWKGFGFGSILYLSTLRGIDPELYESAKLDGASRFKQTLYITLPGIQHIVTINLIFTLGGILSANSELILLLYNSSIYSTADVIGTYMYRSGIEGTKYSYTTAVGLFMSLIGFVLTYITNKVSDKTTGFGLW